MKNTILLLAMMALIPIAVLILVVIIGHKKLKQDNKPYEGNKDEIEELLKWDDIDFNNEVNVNLN